jgi:hypothetical protein
MLTQTIIKFKPVRPVLYVPPTTPTLIGFSKVRSQADLDLMLLNAPPKGSMILWSASTAKAFNEYLVSYVLDICSDFQTVDIGMNGGPCTHNVVQLGVLKNPKVFTRWVDPREYQLVPKESLEKDISADLQNRLKEYVREYEAEKSRTQTSSQK